MSRPQDQSLPPIPAAGRELLAQLEAKYLGWKPPGAASHGVRRVLAQAMECCSDTEVWRLKAEVGAAVLAAVLAAPDARTWLTPKRWGYWCALLGLEEEPSGARGAGGQSPG